MTDIRAYFLPLSRREAAILRVADFVLEGRGMAAGARHREWIEWARQQFIRDDAPRSSASVAPRLDGSLRVELTVTSALQAKALLKSGLIGEEADAALLRHHPYPDKGRTHPRLPDPETVVRAIAIQLLSRAGGGRRTFPAASELYCAWEADRDGLADDPTWDANRHSEALGGIEREFGRLRAA